MEKDHRILPRVAYWLVPQRQQRQKLQALILALAKRFSAPVFVPHVTVYTCSRSSQQQELAVLAALAGSCPAVTLCPVGLDGKDTLTRSLFVKFTAAPVVESLHQSLHRTVPLPSSYELTPHLSLLYQVLPAAVRDVLVCETVFPRQEILFDELWAVAIPAQLKTLDDMVGWQPLMIGRLASSRFVDTIDN